MLNPYRFGNSVEMLSARVRAMESVHQSNEAQLADHNLADEERRCRLRLIQSVDQRLTALKGELADLQSFSTQPDPAEQK